jgi:hypothetical protein
MAVLRQRVLVWMAAAVLLGAFSGLAGASPASAQTAGESPALGFPFNLTFPLVGGYPQTSIFPVQSYSPFTTVVNYAPTSALTTVSYPPNITNATTPTFVSGSTYFATGSYIPAVPLLPVQVNGQYCTDKSNGMVWIPTGSPVPAGIKCGS